MSVSSYIFQWNGSAPLVQESLAARSDLENCYSIDLLFSSDTSTYRFTGKPVSATTGLYYEYSRWYDPTVGRFISKDSFPGIISDPQSLNWYTYASDNPTTYSDPTGFVAVVSYGNGWGPPCPSIWKDPLGSFSCGPSRIPTPVADVVAGYDLAAWGLAECEQECGQLLGDAGRLSSGDVTIAKTGTTTSSTGSITAVTDTTRIATTGDEAASSLTSQITRDSNWVPNPGGRLGGLLHRNGVNDIFNLIKNRGLFPKTEYYVKDAGRFVDVVALDRPFGPGAQVLEAYQVGRMTLGGLPVSREIYAAADIIDKLGIDVIFVPYNV